MAKQQKRGRPKGKAQASKPITSHQLFPAVVALWFGALFGLGSLAVRPSLIESLVMKTRLDLVVPAAAPPLGITARMLMALVLATLGAIVGVAIARQISRPKAELRQRKRGARSERDDDRPMFGQPLSVNEDLDDPEEGGALFSGRRRGALAIEHEEAEFVPHEFAPLPGGAPQVLDITGVEMAEYAPLDAPRNEPAPLDLSVYAQHEAPASEPFAAAPASAPAPFAPPPGTAAQPRQVFQPAPPIDAPAAFTPAPTVPAPSVPDQAAPVASTGRQIFGMPIEDGHVDQSFVRAAGFKTSVFEQDEHQPLFPERPAAPEPAMPVEAASPAAASAPLPPFSTLGLTELASRLRQSILRRRAARAARAAAEATPAPQVQAEAAPVAEPAPALAAQVEPAAAIASFTPVAAPEVTVPAALLLSPAPTHAAPDPAAVVPPAPMAMPAALRPLSFDDHDDEADDMLASLLPPRHIAMPAPVAAPERAEEPAPAAAEVGEEESYASLLDIGQPLLARSQFVRIEEPEADGATIEPVVIFPGHAPLAAVPREMEAMPFRRFDAPSAAGQGGPVASPSPMPAPNPAEAEQALRAALANLQRMSGAA